MTKTFLAFILAIIITLDQEENIILTNSKLGNLNLLELKVDELENQITRAFPNFQIERGIGQQDGPDYVYYSVKDDGEELFVVRLDGHDPNRVDEVWVTSTRIQNKQGISIGNSFEELKQTNQKLRLYTDLHYNIYASQPFYSISYKLKAGTIKMLNDSTMMASDYSVQEWQIDNPDIEFIIWRR